VLVVLLLVTLSLLTVSFQGTSIQKTFYKQFVLCTLDAKFDARSSEESRPPFSDLIGDNNTNITGDVQFLLDFAIIGHAKTGTSALLNWLCSHEEVQMHYGEKHSLKNNKPAELVSLLYDLPPGKRGYKAPNDIRRQALLNALHSYWPYTKLSLLLA